MKYITSELIVVAPLIFFLLLISFPIIGGFAGWKRALYWGIGNLFFYFLGLEFWKFAGYNISNSFGSLFKYYQESFGMNPEDLRRLVNAEVVVSYFCLVLIIANVLLTIFYYLVFKKIAGLKKEKKQEVKLKRGKWVKVRHRDETISVNAKFANAFIGTWTLTLLMMPISTSFSHGMFFVTTTTMTRSDAVLNNAIYYGFQQALSKPYLNWSTYYTSETGDDFDAIYCLHQMYGHEITHIDIDGSSWVEQQSSVKTLNKTLMRTIQYFVTTLKDPDVNTESLSKIEKLSNAFQKTSISINDIYNVSKYDLRILFKSNAMVYAMHNYISKYDGLEVVKLNDNEVESKFKGNNNFCSRMLEAYKKGRIVCDNKQEVTFDIFTKTASTTTQAWKTFTTWILEGFDLSELSEENKAIMTYQIGEIARLFVNDK